jgi:hypothetical protein
MISKNSASFDANFRTAASLTYRRFVLWRFVVGASVA